jgi:hypothetical protein
MQRHLGMLWKTLGTATGPTLVTTGCYTATFEPIAAPTSVTLQTTYTQGGSSPVLELQGAKVVSATFTCGVGEYLRCTLELDGKKLDEAQAAATATYVANPAFAFKDGTVKLGTYSSEAAVAGVRAVSVTINNTLDVEDYNFGSAGLKGEQIRDGHLEITGSFTVKHSSASQAAFGDRFKNTTSTSFVWDFVDTRTAILGTNYPTWRITIPQIYIESATPSPDGPGAVVTDYTFRGTGDGTHAPYTIFTMNPDSAL